VTQKRRPPAEAPSHVHRGHHEVLSDGAGKGDIRPFRRYDQPPHRRMNASMASRMVSGDRLARAVIQAGLGQQKGTLRTTGPALALATHCHGRSGSCRAAATASARARCAWQRVIDCRTVMRSCATDHRSRASGRVISISGSRRSSSSDSEIERV
jgi:hypothetical protein